MTKIALFDAKPYDLASFDAANAGRYDFRYFEARLTAESVPLADGCAGVCAFVNDAVDAATVDGLVARGVKVLALPGVRWRTRSATAAPARPSRRSRRNLFLYRGGLDVDSRVSSSMCLDCGASCGNGEWRECSRRHRLARRRCDTDCK